MVKFPSLFVDAVRFNVVLTFVTVMVVSGITAPLASSTKPPSVAVDD